ncbi:hypothetical protein [Humibacillus xanthopallidus]|nr:hypothetical protein [Humibacillus xanthopallidus]
MVFKDLRPSYGTAKTGLDVEEFQVTADEPGYRDVVVHRDVHSVPGHTLKALRYLNYVIPYQQ